MNCFDHDFRDVVVIVMNMVVATDALNFRSPFVDLAVWLASNQLVFGTAQVHVIDTEQLFDMLKNKSEHKKKSDINVSILWKHYFFQIKTKYSPSWNTVSTFKPYVAHVS